MKWVYAVLFAAFIGLFAGIWMQMAETLLLWITFALLALGVYVLKELNGNKD